MWAAQTDVSQRVQYGKIEEKKNFTVEKPEKHCLKSGSTATTISHIDSMHPCCDVNVL